MTKTKQVHAFYWAAIGILAAVLICILATGCGDRPPATAQLARPDASGPDVEATPELSPEYSDALQRLIDERKGNSDGFLYLDSEEMHDAIDKPRGASGDIEKGSYPALLGWGMRGCLAYQDGLPEYCGEDHCSAYGLVCDATWHSQMAEVAYYDEATFLANMTGSCAPTGATAWEPCILPDLQPATRYWPWFLDVDTCTPDPTVRQLMHDAMAQVARYTTDFALIEMPEVLDESQAAIRVYCTNGAADGPRAASWSPYGAMQLRYMLADPDGATVVDTFCDLPGYPGNARNSAYSQSMDSHYTYSAGDVAVNIESVLDVITDCASDPVELLWGLRNTFMHEMGHNWGFQHDQWIDPTTGVMWQGPIPCEYIVAAPQGYGPLRLNALYDLDVSTSTDELTVYDDKLACYLPI